MKMSIVIMLMKNNFLKCVINLMFKETDVEIWKDIEGFEGLYAVSTKGRVRNLKTNRIFAERYDGAGYRAVTLKGKNYNVHRLMALAFLPNPDNLPQINHIDENKKNNDISNLAWVSIEDNIRHSIHNQSCKINQLTLDDELVNVWNSIRQIERELGYKRGGIIRACKGKQEYAYGYIWRYANPDSQRVMNRPVIVYKGSERIGEFASATKVSEALGLRYRSVSDCLKGRHATLHGYSFKYAE